MTKKKKRERDKAIDSLHRWISPGDTVFTILDHVSRSGMMRHIRVLLPFTRDDGTIDHLHPNGAISDALDIRQTPSSALKMTGCGMDMGFQLVYILSRTLYPDGFTCTGRSCRSNDHSNGDRDRTPHHHKDGGYALRQQWL